MQTVPRPDISHYVYRVTWSVEDDEFVATCTEFPSLSWLASSKIEAIKGLEQLLHEVIADMEAQGEEVPQPFSERSFSGKFNVRVGESLHRALATHAAEDGMSLNQYVVRKLAAACSTDSSRLRA
jgi:predicted HicB family RNase H-like nuclease